MKYTQETLYSALAFVDKLEATGGTELLEALRQTLTPKLVDGYKRQLLILTDGEVSNISDVVSLAQASSNDTRIFTIGKI